MRLRELQRHFASGVLADDSSSIERHVDPGRFGAARHLRVYRNNVYTSLTDALAAVYPAVARLVGADGFRGCGYHYIRYAPPASGNLHDFGERFAEFLTSFEAVRAATYLPDVARLEWARHRAYHAADAGPLALDALARVAPDRYAALRFDLHPSAHLLASDYPLLDIWRINQPDAPPDEIVDLDKGGVKLLVARRELAVEIEAIGEAEYALLHGFAERASFADAAAYAAARQPDFDLAANLRRRVQDQTIVGFRAD